MVKGLKKTTLFSGALGAKDAAAAEAPALAGDDSNDDDLEGEVRRVAPRVVEEDKEYMGNRGGRGDVWGYGE